MGNKQQENKQGLPNQKIEHRHMGEIEAITHPQYGGCFLKVYHFADQMMSHEKFRRMQARIKKYNNCDHVVGLKGVQVLDKQEMCGHNSDLYLYFQRLTQSLRTVVDSKYKEKKNFTEIEILKFLKMTIGTLIFLQDNGFKNNQLDKDSILFCGDKVKILDMAIASNCPYQEILDGKRHQDGCYLAPELLKDLKEKNYEPFLSPKSDVFSLGMLTVEMACLEPLDSYYDFENFSIDYESLIHRVSRIVYSVELKTLLAGMLEYEGQQRLGLISLQQKVHKMMKIESQPNQAKRSRSSSTKMLKQLLTSSRKSLLTSQKNTNFQTLNRKSSTASLTSMSSMNPRNSLNKQLERKKEITTRKESIAFPSSEETNFLRNMVRNKTSAIQSTNPQVASSIKKDADEVPKIVINKENLDGFSNTKNSYIQSIKALHDVRRSSYNSKTFFDVPCYNSSKEQFATTPKAPQPYFRKQKKQEESIFRLIQQDPRYNSNCSKGFSQSKVSGQLSIDRSQKKIYKQTNEPILSPIDPPKVARVQETSSIPRPEPIQHQQQNVTPFGQEQKQIAIMVSPPKEVTEVESISLRVKKSLDNMYKTTKSITSSAERSSHASASGSKELYKKIHLNSGYIYEGEVKENDVFEGNGILYAPSGQVLYNGSWVDGKYDGFGTLYNLEVTKGEADKFDLGSSTGNWVKYEGEFKKNEKQGFGTIYFFNGERFSGCMKNGEVSGYGCFYDSLNQMTSGIWACNKLQA